jgi:hypothetical protein
MEQRRRRLKVKVEEEAKIQAQIHVPTHVPTPVPTPVATQSKIRPDERREILRETQRPLGAGNHKSQTGPNVSMTQTSNPNSEDPSSDSGRHLVSSVKSVDDPLRDRDRVP